MRTFRRPGNGARNACIEPEWLLVTRALRSPASTPGFETMNGIKKLKTILTAVAAEA